jgi:hypothetical protein
MQQLTRGEYAQVVSISLRSTRWLSAAMLATSQHVFRPHCGCDAGVAHELMDCADVLDAIQRGWLPTEWRRVSVVAGVMAPGDDAHAHRCMEKAHPRSHYRPDSHRAPVTPAEKQPG